MANQRKLIGRLPVFKGEWSSLKTYNKLNEVTLYGSSFRSKIDGNTYKPAELNSSGTGMIVNENWYVVANGTDAYLAGEKIASIDGNTSTYNVSRFHQHTGFWEAVEYDESEPAYLEAQEYTAGNRVNLVNYTNHTFVAMKSMTGMMPDYNNISNKFTLEEAILFVPSKYRLTGMNVGFLDSSNKPVVHKHKGGTFTNVSNWEEDVQTQLTELSSNTDRVVSESSGTADTLGIQSASISFTAAYQQRKMPFTIKSGTLIRLKGEQITCRTNEDDSDYQTVTDGTVADRDINWVKSSAIGEVLIRIENGIGLSTWISRICGFDRVTELNFDMAYSLAKQVPFTIPAGAVISFYGPTNSTLTGRTNENDEDYQTIVNGTVADRDINWIRNQSESGKYLISFSTASTGLNSFISNLNKILSGGSLCAVDFPGNYQQRKIPFTIPRGKTINIYGNVTQITCRTNKDDSDYQTVTDGTVADRDINWVKSGVESGACIIVVTGEYGIVKEIKEIHNALGYSKTELTEQETILKSFIKPDFSIGDSSTDSTTVGVFNVENCESLSITMQTGNQYTQPYCFYDFDDSVVSDENDFQEIIGNGIYVSNKELIVPEKAKCLKITYNNTYDHSVFSIKKNFISKLEFDNIVKKAETLEGSINASKEGTGIAYRVSSKLMLRPLKILGVGNSWTNNATAYLGNILTDLGVKVELNVSYAGSATLQSYWNNIESDNASYDFRKWREGEGWIEPETKSTYKDILLADDWDIVTHQQQSGNGGNYPSFQPYLHNIINFEKSLVRVMPLFFMHATWAYPNGSTAHTEIFESLYGSNTDTMYNAVLDAYNSAMTDEGIINVMPSTPMVQQVRQLGIPNIDLTDGSHLNINGQFAVSCVWAEMLLRNYFDKSVASELSILSSTYRPDGLSEENAAKIRELAKTIVENVKTYFPLQS